MNFWYSLILNKCILIPAITGLVRFGKISRAFYPFVYCIWIGAITEISSDILILNRHSNAIITDIYILVESLFFIWLFNNWKLFYRNKVYFKVIGACLLVGWTIEMLLFATPIYFNSYFRIGDSFLVVIMSITIMNRLITLERKSLLKNAVFLFCISFVFYYTFQILVEVFMLYGESFKIRMFSRNVYYISTFTNFITNLLYTIAILWIPARQNFTIPSS